jgi:hypothetical protein
VQPNPRTINFRAENGLVICEIRTSPNPADLQADADAPTAFLEAKFVWLPDHWAEEKFRLALDGAIELAKTQVLA